MRTSDECPQAGPGLAHADRLVRDTVVKASAVTSPTASEPKILFMGLTMISCVDAGKCAKPYEPMGASEGVL
jgi:hypothetical protein